MQLARLNCDQSRDSRGGKIGTRRAIYKIKLERQRLTTYIGNEAITPSRNVHYITFTSLAITQGTPQLGDVEA